jgi:hypothetical protein
MTPPYPHPINETFLAETTALLERTPRVVRALLDGLPDTWPGTPDTPDGWTPRLDRPASPA